MTRTRRRSLIARDTSGTFVCLENNDVILNWITRMDQPRGFIINLTPDLAELFMALNTKNRTISEGTIRKYVAAIQDGDWVLSPDPIVFDMDGTMIQGQHRCLAVIKSGIPIQVRLDVGWPTDVFAYLDRGKKRSNADVLSIDGEKYANTKASCAMMLFNFEKGRREFWKGSKELSPKMLRSVLESYPDIQNSIETVYRIKGKSEVKHTSISLLSLAHYFHAKKDEELANAFLETLYEGVNSTVYPQAYAARRKLLVSQNAVTQARKLSPTERYVLVLWAYKRHMEGKMTKFSMPKTPNPVWF